MSTWPATVFSLTLAGFLFLFGRLADTFGGYPVFLGGCVWFLGTSLITGFCQTSITLIVLRALQGLGPAALLPAASKLLYAIYPEGQRRTSMVGLYTAGAPTGVFVGMLVAGATVEYLRWQWYFWFGSICLFLMSILTWFIIPKISPQSRQYLRWTDWIGSLLIIIGLMLVIFGISYNLGQDSGWRLALRISTLVSGVLLLVASALIGRRTERPLIPMPQGHCADMVVITLVQLFSYGSFGIFMFYGALW
jgi:MFS family permease